MEDLGKVAIGRFVLRSKEALVAIRPVDGVLVLETMRFADEVLAPDREQPLAEPASEPSEREKEMARQLVQLAHRRRSIPRSTTTSTARSCSRSSTRRPRARRSSPRPSTEEPAKVLDLMAALEASLDACRREAGEERSAQGHEEVAARTAKPAKRAAAKKAVGEEDDGEEGRRQAHPQVGLTRRAGRYRRRDRS